MKYQNILLVSFFLISSHLVFSQNLDSLKTSIFPDDGPAILDNSGLSFTTNYVPSNSFWASPFPESDVYHALLKYDHPSNPDQSYELRLGKGGQIYSFLTSSGETVPPQYPAVAPWVDEVWQMVAVDGVLNDPLNDLAYFIHQAGVYLKTPEQMQPFYSPIIAEYYDDEDQSYTIVNWGLQAHTSDNLFSGYTSSLLYYTRYKNIGNGIIQVDYLMYNFGDDTISFINIPWGGVRRSTYDHWFASNPDHTYYEETGTFTSYTELLTNTGGWAAFSSDPLGSAPTLALIMDNDEGTLRLGDAGQISNRDYTVFEGIKFPGTDLTSGKAIRARNYYLLDSDINSIQTNIINNLENETYYGPFNKSSTEVDSTAYSFDYQGNELIATETNYANGLQLKLRPFLNSYPVFLMQSTDEAYRITSDLYTYSPLPYDGKLADVQLLGYTNNPTKVEIESALICSGENYTFPDGSTQNAIISTTRYISSVGLAFNGYDSLVYTIIHVDESTIPSTNFINNGPGGVGSTNGASSLALWLDANQLLGENTTNPTNGIAIDKWTDKSGFNNHYNNSGVNRPTYNTSNYNAVNFDALAASPQFLNGTQERHHPYGSVFIALNATDAGTSSTLLSSSDLNLKYEQVPNSGFIGYSEIGINDYTSTIPSLFGTDNIVSFHANCNKNEIELRAGNVSQNLNVGNSTNGIPLGSIGTATEKAAGDYYEIIAYQNTLNTVEQILVDNYLSAKYGNISISNDLYDEDDNVNGDFDFDVAGIGRIDVNNIHDDAIGTGFLRVNNPSNLDDGEFLIWGDNGDSVIFDNETDLPNTVIAKARKVWKISEVNLSANPIDIGNIDLHFDLSSLGLSSLENIILLIDTNNNGIFADENHIESSTISSSDFEGQTIISFENMSGSLVQDGTRLSLGYLTPDAPGGIYPNLALWLSADKNLADQNGMQIIWSDQSEQKHIATGIGPSIGNTAPKLLNYNPVATFDGVDDQLVLSSGIFGSETYNDVNIFIMQRLNAVPHQSTIIRESVVGGGISSHMPWENGRVFWDAGISNGDGRINVLSGMTEGDDAFWTLLSHNGTTDLQAIRKNGKMLNSDNTAISMTGNNSNMAIGSANGGLYFEGDVAEVIIYLGNEELETTAINQIESYLALKYAKTLDNTNGGTAGDYFNAEGELIWDADDNSAYHNDVIGISRDDASTFEQKQSKSSDDNLAVYIENLAADNIQNTTAISNNLSSIIIGNNEGELFDPSPSNSTEQPVGTYSRLAREWKITNTNFIDNFSLKLEWSEFGNFDINDIRLLVDNDGDFSDAQIFGAPDVSISEGSIIVYGINPSMIPLNSTRYITIASVNGNTPLLPIELLSFDAIERDGIIHLDWQTTTEINNNYFIIERSINGENWEEVILINGAGNSSEMLHYHSKDEKPYEGISYYRLKQIDFDESFSYSEIKTIEIIHNSTIQIYPIPFKNQITIEGNEEELSQIAFYNVLGEDVTYLIHINNQGTFAVSNLKNLVAGIYIVKTKSVVSMIYKE
jgi:hypothetical protein